MASMAVGWSPLGSYGAWRWNGFMVPFSPLEAANGEGGLQSTTHQKEAGSPMGPGPGRRRPHSGHGAQQGNLQHEQLEGDETDDAVHQGSQEGTAQAVAQLESLDQPGGGRKQDR